MEPEPYILLCFIGQDSFLLNMWSNLVLFGSADLHKIYASWPNGFQMSEQFCSPIQIFPNQPISSEALFLKLAILSF